MSLLDKASLVQIPSGYGDGKLYSVKPTPTFGSELITNGDFSSDSDWSLGSGWSIGSGSLNAIGAGNYAVQTNVLAQSTNAILKVQWTQTITSGTRLRFFARNYNDGGSETVLSGSATDGGVYSNSNCVGSGTYTIYVSVTNGYSFKLLAESGNNATVDNVSVKEILVADGDFDFSRSSSGTRVNSEGVIEVAQIIGSELVVNGDFATDTWWQKSSSNVNISNGKGNYTAGTTEYFYKSNFLTVGKKYKVTFEITDYTTGYISAFGGNWSGAAVGVGTYVRYINNCIDATFGLVGNTFVGSIDNVSVKEVIENDVPRLDYSGSCASLLLEPQTQNLVTYSENFSQWNTLSANAATYISDLVNPDGSVGGYKISGDGVYLPTSLSATTQRSIYARSVSGSGEVQLMTHNSNTNNVFTLTEEWQRFDLNSVTSATGQSFFYIDLRGASTILSEFYVWGAQATNDQSYVTSYIPSNSGSSTTRTADVCNNAGTSATFNSTEGVLFAEIKPISEGISISLSDGTISNRVAFYYQNGIDIRGNIRIANSQVNISGGGNISDAYHKIALRWDDDTNILTFYKDGSLVGSVSYSGSLGANTLNNISFTQGDGTSSNFYGKTKQLMVFDEALSDSELQALTS